MWSLFSKPALYRRLQKHFDCNPEGLPVVEQKYEMHDRSNCQLTIDSFAKQSDPPLEVIGVISNEEYDGISLARIAHSQTAAKYDEGPVQFFDEELPREQRLSCIRRGLILFHVAREPIALLLFDNLFGHAMGIHASIMARTKEKAEAFARQFAKLVREGPALRGHVLSLTRDCLGVSILKFHKLPEINRDQVILPESLLQRIERHTISFSQHAARLSAAGRHLKRGILLHGPPGTGKTLTAMYLAARMPGRTVFLMTGSGLGSIETACQIARLLTPATIILEDVDLIGTERDSQAVGPNALLFELLNQMDGLADDADLLFILTTNRPEILEPALATRPGRIDQAISVPLPDEDCRRRIFSLYAKGLKLEVRELDSIIERMEGVSAAFIREVLRKGAVIAALDDEEELIVRDQHLNEALAELLVEGGPLTHSLLGAKKEVKGFGAARQGCADGRC